MNTALIEANRAYKICTFEFKILKPDADFCRTRFLARRLKEEVAKGNIRKGK